jgi:hypothetical protein
MIQDVVIPYAVKYNGLMLEYASPELKDDVEIVSVAMGNNPYAFKFASPRLREDYSVAMSAVMNTCDHKIMIYVGSKLCDNFTFMSNAIKYDAYCLKYASKD